MRYDIVIPKTMNYMVVVTKEKPLDKDFSQEAFLFLYIRKKLPVVCHSIIFLFSDSCYDL